MARPSPETISLKKNYSKIADGPSPKDLFSSLMLFNNPGTLVKFALKPSSGRGSNQVITARVIGIRAQGVDGSTWIVHIKPLSLVGRKERIEEAELKIYYHESCLGMILE